MNKYKLIISYDGTDFQGWQSQSHKKTISDTLSSSFKRIFGETVSIIGASRTDSGVHAFGQVAMFKSALSITPERMMEAWNEALPEGIYIRSLNHATEEFHPLKNVEQKEYYYNIFIKPPLPFYARYGWHYYMIDKVDIAKFKDVLRLYEGEHDFRSFCKLEGEKDTVRTVDSITTRMINRLGMLQVVIKGKGFLHYQIRRMIGYAIDVARRDDLSVDYIQSLLDNPSSKQTLLKADAKGLFLRRIRYVGDR